MKLKTYDNLSFVFDKYANNGHIYIWLIDKDTWEPFADITENHPELTDDDLLVDNNWQKVIIDNDFISLFQSIRECKSWCMDNLNCLWGAEVDWRPALYIDFNMLASIWPADHL